ncbi:DUF3748 domain-containing protein [Catalinimonas niigatensis]|uniref:DUF3748 domain-containing protein n=1 Tax=Catalinimonas niigatensis TaxID=1397264 RepID=UPI002666D4F1|nr:DUF3748 domain-containing protein [Catalinimonas niigatensis]WPP51900.1 DUF3748 domain-containing protein [Catalinimonas niigatensis]
MKFEETQLTSDEKGHCLYNTQCFSPDNQWIVYDTRHHDTLISHTGTIEMVNVATGEMKKIYETSNQTQYGPGVGAATFSPVADQVLFIHGIRNANQERPYSMTRRTGVAVNIAQPLKPIFMDARDVTEPFTAGALRGGTHAHTWSGDGQWISFTYNDEVIEQLDKSKYDIRDMRTVGVMMPAGPVQVEDDSRLENNSGELFSVVAAQVTDQPAWGSDEIDKAYDEGWIGTEGYRKQDLSWQKRAIAFQGDLKDSLGNTHTEIFVLDLPEDPSQARADKKPLEGTATTPPNVPDGVAQRRITFTSKGIIGPRHWLRTTSEGTMIGFLSEDTQGVIQIFGVSLNGGEVKPLTANPFSVQGSFNFSPNSRYLAYPADNSIFITDLETGKSDRITARFTDEDAPVGGVVWSNDGRMLAYNRYVKSNEGRYLQIFLLKDQAK